jgi:hypothetical protein
MTSNETRDRSESFERDVEISLDKSISQRSMRRRQLQGEDDRKRSRADRSRDLSVKRIIDLSNRRTHACFRGRPRPFFCCVSPIARAPAITCLPAFDRGSLPCLFPPLCLHCARSRALNLSRRRPARREGGMNLMK